MWKEREFELYLEMLKGCVLRYTYRLVDVEWLREEVVEYSDIQWSVTVAFIDNWLKIKSPMNWKKTSAMSTTQALYELNKYM